MKKYPFLAAAILALSLAGSAHAQVSAEISIGGPPPPPREEIVPVAPGPDYAWHKGYWHVRDHQYVWMPGAYERRPHAGAEWVEPVYAQHGDHWGYTEGHWR